MSKRMETVSKKIQGRRGKKADEDDENAVHNGWK